MEQDILSDMENICQGKDPRKMCALEIGCGAGRVTRALANLFGEVHAVDVSEEMVRLAREALAGTPNAHVYRNNGFAYSTCVFHHIGRRDVIENYVREVNGRLRARAACSSSKCRAR